MIIEIIFKWYFIDFFTFYFDPVPNCQWIFIEISTHNKLSFNEYFIITLYWLNFNYSLLWLLLLLLLWGGHRREPRPQNTESRAVSYLYLSDFLGEKKVLISFQNISQFVWIVATRAKIHRAMRKCYAAFFNRDRLEQRNVILLY
jgi:hypothetical protein